MTTIEIKHRYTGATLFSADVPTLREALERAVKAGADLQGADLRNADLRYADLRNADLRDADLRDADLRDADLRDADLRNADLQNSKNFSVDYLKPVRDDLRAVLDARPAEVRGLLAKLWAGEIEGSLYEGPCSCLVGTIATLAGEHYTALKGLVPNSTRPSERWFLRIHKGSTPVNCPSAAFAAAVISQWMDEHPTT